MTIKITVNFDRVRLFLNNSKVTVLNGSTSERYVEAYLSFHFHYSAFSRKVRINLALIREILKVLKRRKPLGFFSLPIVCLARFLLKFIVNFNY